MTREAFGQSLAVQRYIRDAEAAAEPIFGLSQDATIMFVNRAAARLLGSTGPEICGRSFWSFWTDPDSGSTPPRAGGPSAEPALSERPLDRLFGVRLKSDDEEHAPVVDVVFFPVEGFTWAVATDRTELEQLRTRARQKDRMSTLGELAAGLGHRINDPLCGLFAELSGAREQLRVLTAGVEGEGGLEERLQSALGMMGEISSSIAEAQRAARRIRDVAESLHSFGRDSSHAGPVDAHVAVDAALNIAMNELRHCARLVKDYADIPLVWANETNLTHAFLNLIVNAIQAFDAPNVTVNEIRVTSRTVGDDVEVEIRDNGRGIDPSHHERVWDPFFSTRKRGQGSGLGLTICRTLIGEVGGTVQLESDAGRGSRFLVRLPKTLRKLRYGRPLGVERRATILVADDDELVARSLARLLRPHRVVVAATGEQAVIALLESDFDVVFCDIMMPDISGKEVYDRVRSVRPGIHERFVFITGGPFTPEARAFMERVPNRSAHKPFDLDEIRRIVEEMVAS